MNLRAVSSLLFGRPQSSTVLARRRKRPQNAVIESLESRILLAADLRPSMINAPATGSPGGTISVSTAVANGGDTASGSYVVRYYASRDATITSGDTLLKSVTRTTLNPSVTHQWNETVALPSNLGTGVWYVGVIVDATNAVVETDESNNALADLQPLVIPAPPSVDFLPTLIQGPAAGDGGTSVVVSTAVRNQGDAGSGSFTVAYYLSTDADVTTSDVRIKTVTRSALAAGGLQQWDESVLLPTSLATGDYYLGMIVDPSNAVAEGLETNNALAEGTTIHITAPSLVDLSPTALDGPTTGLRGGIVSVTTRVSNLGPGASGTYEVSYYLSTDANVTTADTLIKTVSRATIGGYGTQRWTESISIPSSIAAGTYYLGIVIDPTNAIRERNEANNTRADAQPIVISIPQIIDFVPVLVEGPFAAEGGSSVDVSTTVRNQGTSDAGSYTVGYYLSTDATITTGDLRLKTATLMGLAAGEQQQWDETVVLPSNLATGTYYLGVVVDPSSAILETVESNNVLGGSTSIRITAPPLVDLTPVKLDGPTTGLTGRTISVLTKISNLGPRASGAYSVAYYLSTDADVTTADTLIKTTTRTSIAGGGAQQWTESLTIPSSMAEGTYYLGIVVDPTDEIRERSEANNTLADAQPIVIGIPQVVDFVPVLVEGPSAAEGGSSVDVSTTVRNQGTSDAGSYTVGYYLSADARITTSDLRLKTVTLMGLAAGGQQQWDESVVLPSNLATGTYYLGIVVDPSNAILETVESNNVLGGSTSIRITAPPLLDLTPVTLDGPTTGLTGRTISVLTKVSNLGPGASGAYAVGYYLSTDADVTTADTLIKTATRTSIAGGGAQQWTESITIPSSMAEGTYYLGIVVDPTDAIRERNEANNTLADAQPIVIGIPQLIDFVPTLIDGPTAGDGGASITVATAVRNQGSSDSGTFEVAYYLSTDATITTSDTRVKTVTRPGIVAGGLQEWFESIELPTNLATGNYYLGIVVDWEKAVSETVETNNVLRDTTTIRLTAPSRIDLNPTRVDGPTTGTSGSTISVATSVANQGSASSGAYGVNYYLSTDATVTTEDTLLKTSSRASIAANGTVQWTEVVTIPSSVAAGTYYIGAIVDPGNTIREFDETNNVAVDGAAIVVGAAPPAPPEFTISLTFSGLTSSQIAIFNQAAARWSEIITGDLPNVVYQGTTIDDVRISASAVSIDGVGGVLGQAGPTRLRAGSYLPYLGTMQFDSADLANMESNGMLLSVILHEMGHVLGIGTIWSYKGLISGAGGAAPIFTGTQATLAYNQIFGTSAAGVPVEGNNSPVGSRDSHWRESVFRTELMTPYISGATNPISRVTVASLADLGYTVDMSAADPYVAPGSSVVSAVASGSAKSPSIVYSPFGANDTWTRFWSEVAAKRTTNDGASHGHEHDEEEIVPVVDEPPHDAALAFWTSNPAGGEATEVDPRSHQAEDTARPTFAAPGAAGWIESTLAALEPGALGLLMA